MYCNVVLALQACNLKAGFMGRPTKTPWPIKARYGAFDCRHEIKPQTKINSCHFKGCVPGWWVDSFDVCIFFHSFNSTTAQNAPTDFQAW